MPDGITPGADCDVNVNARTNHGNGTGGVHPKCAACSYRAAALSGAGDSLGDFTS